MSGVKKSQVRFLAGHTSLFFSSLFFFFFNVLFIETVKGIQNLAIRIIRPCLYVAQSMNSR